MARPRSPQNILQGLVDVDRLARAASCSVTGLRTALRSETAFRQEIILFVVLAPLAFWVGRSAVERSILLGTLLIVLIVELLNSAIEATVDRIGMEHHTLSGRAKDMASAAVYLSLLMAVVVWGLVLYERFGAV